MRERDAAQKARSTARSTPSRSTRRPSSPSPRTRTLHRSRPGRPLRSHRVRSGGRRVRPRAPLAPGAGEPPGPAREPPGQRGGARDPVRRRRTVRHGPSAEIRREFRDGLRRFDAHTLSERADPGKRRPPSRLPGRPRVSQSGGPAGRESRMAPSGGRPGRRLPPRIPRRDCARSGSPADAGTAARRRASAASVRSAGFQGERTSRCRKRRDAR